MGARLRPLCNLKKISTLVTYDEFSEKGGRQQKTGMCGDGCELHTPAYTVLLLAVGLFSVQLYH